MGVQKHIGFKDRETLEISQWELENLHLPPVTTLTLYESSPPITFIRRRLALILEKNLWLSSRIVKKYKRSRGGIGL